MVHIKKLNEMMTTDGDWDLGEIRIDFFDEEEKKMERRCMENTRRQRGRRMRGVYIRGRQG